jgi:hypothetical protein
MDRRVDRIREVLSSNDINLDKLDDDTGIFDHVDDFVKLSRENKQLSTLFCGV